MKLGPKARHAVVLLAFGVVIATAQAPSDRFYQAIRANDIASLPALIQASDVNLKDQRGATPLMYSAAFGSLEAMKVLVEAGADVNAKNAFDATALHWCTGDPDKVRLLIEKGADVNARSKMGRTPLVIASAIDGNSEIVKLLLDHGAKVNVADNQLTTPLSSAADANDTASIKLLIDRGANTKDIGGAIALMNAAAAGNVEVLRLLLAKGGNVNAVSPPQVGPPVKNGPIALGSFTPLILASSMGGPDMVKVLLDAGAKVNAQDVRGMTPLILAVATDRADPRVVRLLLDKGADPAIKDKSGESAVDWARKFSHPAILQALGVEPMKSAAAPVLIPAGTRKLADAREAVEKSLALLQRNSTGFFVQGGCVACHAQNLTGIASSVARANGVHVDEAAIPERLKLTRFGAAQVEQPMLQAVIQPGGIDIMMYSILALGAEGAPPDRAIDAMVHYIAAEQHQDGSWHMSFVARPPMEDGDFSRTALALHALQLYGIPGRKAEFDQRIARAAAWLAANTPRTTEDLNMQLLAFKWTNANNTALTSGQRKLLALQRPDGGWAQTPELASDAYATGQTLHTLHELGVPPTDPVYRRGVAYLISTQLADGSWHVRSRALKFQPYFQGGFPHDHDQWISSSATAWATIGLAYALGPQSASR